MWLKWADFNRGHCQSLQYQTIILFIVLTWDVVIVVVIPTKIWVLVVWVFTTLHGMQTQSSDENSVCPFIQASVKCVHCEKTEERSVQIFIPHERSFSLVFWEEESLVGRSTSAVSRSKKSSINASRKSTISNRKSNTGFQLVPTSMTLNSIIALILHFFTEFDCFAGQLRHSGWRYVYCL